MQEWVSIPEGFAFGDGGESAKQGAALPTLASHFGASPGAVPPFQGSKACSPPGADCTFVPKVV